MQKQMIITRWETMQKKRNTLYKQLSNHEPIGYVWRKMCDTSMTGTFNKELIHQWCENDKIFS